MPVTILLLQARHPGDPVREEERRSFAREVGLPVESIVPHDLLGGPPTVRQALSHAALMVGGSGDFYVSRGDLPDHDGVLEFLVEVVERGHPTFASCFGFQLLTVALGGKIVHDPGSIQVGTYELTLTEEGRSDPVFGWLPSPFLAQLGRKDRARVLPPAAVHLATSEVCDYQAFRLPEKPVWATQFHPELDREANLRRYLRYQEGYAGHLSPAEREAIVDRFLDSPHAHRLLQRFLEIVVW